MCAKSICRKAKGFGFKQSYQGWQQLFSLFWACIYQRKIMYSLLFLFATIISILSIYKGFINKWYHTWNKILLLITNQDVQWYVLSVKHVFILFTFLMKTLTIISIFYTKKSFLIICTNAAVFLLFVHETWDFWRILVNYNFCLTPFKSVEENIPIYGYLKLN